MKQHIVMDVDTGIDDAMAIMLAVKHPDIVIHAITCVDGNAPLEKVVDNTCRILDLVDAPDIPVVGGASRPLIESPHYAPWVHGADGLGGLNLPTSDRRAHPGHAVEFLRNLLETAEQPLTVVALAPLTNIALLVRTYPHLREKIEKILFMGGSASVGNATAVAEFNFWHDPEAAAITLSSGIPLTMYGLDVFNEVSITETELQSLRAGHSAVARAVAHLAGHEVANDGTNSNAPYTLIGDAGAVCLLVAPEHFTCETWPVKVELAPGAGRGQSYVDRRHRELRPRSEAWPDVQVAMGVDGKAVADLFLRTVVAGS